MNMKKSLWRFAGLLFLLAVLPGFTGCQSKVCDARGPSEECEVHHEFMESVEVPYKTQPLPSPDYLQARIRFFPHAYPFVLPEKCPKTMVYICEDCVKAEAAWVQWNATQKK